MINQRILLEQYANECQFSVYYVYVDDGWSGCNFDRPAFRQMLADIEAGHVNTVITKDLSRLGRDYILTGHYLERYFPEHKVRYISLLDGIDTGNDRSANDITPFRAIMNDLYARDISRKITAVKRDKQKRGEFIGGKPAYGYRMHPTEKNRVMIDEPAASVVRRIFALAMQTDSCRAVADILNAEGIPSPSVYANLKTHAVWSGERIREILQNEIYLGNMVQGRRVKASYKSKKCLRRQKMDWIIVPDTHDAVIDPATFQAVQHILSGRQRTRTRTYSHPLKGLVYCSECHRPLSLINRKNAAGSDTLYFLCRTGERQNDAVRCKQRCVKASAITDAVVYSILSEYSSEFSFDRLLKLTASHLREHKRHSDSPLSSLELQLMKLNEKIDRICMDQLNQFLDRSDFERLYNELRSRRNALLHKLSEENTQIHKMPPAPDPAEMTNRFLDSLKDNRELLSLLIEQIDLSEDRTLHIVYRNGR